jgi:hypothetical protein
LQRRVTVEAIQGEIDRYDAEAASAISARVRAEAGIDAWLDRIVQYYHACIKEHHSMPSTRGHWSRSTASYLQDWRPRINDQWPWLEEWQQLREQLDNAALQQDAPILGVTVPFASRDDKHPTPVTLRGFSVIEEWGRWTDGDEAVLMTRLPHLSDEDLLVRFDVRAFLAPPAPCLDVEVIVNGTPLANWHFDLDDPTTLGLREVPLSSSITGGLDVVWFHFRINKAKSPMELRMSDDPRRLGIGFVSLTFERATPPIR